MASEEDVVAHVSGNHKEVSTLVRTGVLLIQHAVSQTERRQRAGQVAWYGCAVVL